jgi:GNAT superfamily N-acetyltransferase
MTRLSFRPANPADATLLGRMVLDGVRHWGHDVNHPEAFAALRDHGLPTADYLTTEPVYVLEDEGRVIGFYGLAVDEEDFVDLRFMFLEPDRIGAGNGRRLWQHAVREAATYRSRLRIMSDPDAVGFYTAMGAEPETEVEVAPEFRLTMFWYTLAR